MGLLGLFGASWGLLGPSPQKVAREAAGVPRGNGTSPDGFGNLGSGPFKESSGLRTEAQGIRQRT